MKPKKIAVVYDCGTDEMRGLETRISIAYDPHTNAAGDVNKFISAFTLNSNGDTVSAVRLELTDEIIKEILGIWATE